MIFLLEARGGEYRFAILVFFVLASVLGIPLSWHKTLIRSSGSASNCYLSHHGRSEKKPNKAHVGNTGVAAHQSRQHGHREKNNFMLNRQPWRKLKKRETCSSGVAAESRHLMVQSRLLLWSVLHALSTLHSSWRAYTSCYRHAALHGPV